MASTVMKEGQGTAMRDMAKDDKEKAKNMSHFSENNLCLSRMGQIMSAFVDQAFELEFDGESHLFQFMTQRVRVVWDGARGRSCCVPRPFLYFYLTLLCPDGLGA